ncbi:MAG: SRPBCC family protein [Candidatus Promineifilaceae bacterium]
MTDTTFTYKRDECTVVIERVFDAPRERVWRTITDPALIPSWWGPEKYPTRVEEMDVRVGGRWRFISDDGQGNEMPFSGVYKELDPPARLVQTFNFEPIGPGHESTETTILSETEDGKTRMTVTAVYGSLADYDGTIESGMEGGARETWQRLADLLSEIQRERAAVE